MNASAPIGLIDLAHLADVLSQVGFSPITGPDYRTAATSIRAGLDSGQPFPILVSDTPWPGMRAWMEKAARQTRVVVLHGAGGSDTEFNGTVPVRLPAALEDILAAAGYTPNGSTAGLYLNAEGQVTRDAAPVQPEEPVFTAPAPVQPVAPVEVHVAAPPTQQVAQPVAQPVAQEVEDPWETPAGPTAPYAAPAQPVVPVAPVQPVTQQVEDPWEADEQQQQQVATMVAEQPTAPAAPVAPAPEPFAFTPPPTETPVAPPVAVEDPWEEPASPVARTAPVAPVQGGFDALDAPLDPVTYEPVLTAPAPQPVEAPQPTAPSPIAPPVAEPIAFTPPPTETPIEIVEFAPTEPVTPPVAPASQPVTFTAPDPVVDAPAPVTPTPQAFRAPAVEQPAAPVAPVAPTQEPFAFTPPPTETPVAPPATPVAPAAPMAEEPVVAPAYTPAYEPANESGYESGYAAESEDDGVAIVAPPTRFEAIEPETSQTAAGDATDIAAAAMNRTITPAPAGQGLAETVIVWAGKGGVGKSTTSFSLAQRAAKAGLRVVLIDANFGQGDLRTFLRIGNAGLPSVYQAALSGDLRQALIDPDTLNTSRSPKLDPLNFALVQAPPAHLVNPDVVTPEVYMNVVEQARRVCDVVVIDTQIIEAADKFGMVDRFVEPLLRAGAWGVGISDLSSAGISNLLTRLKAFAGTGIPRERGVTMLNRIPRGVQFNIEGVASAFNEHSQFLGTVYADDSIPEAMNRGRAVSNNIVLAPILDAALNRITGLEEFSPNAAAAAEAAADIAAGSHTKTGGGFLGRFRKGKR